MEANAPAVSPAAPRPRLQLPELGRDDYYRFHTMVKPSGSHCNLGCDYCFYLHKKTLLHQPAAPHMSDAVLKEHIRQYIEAQIGPEVVFTWQGGEPTLMGLEFFQRVVELQPHYKKPNQAIENDLQTNGVLLHDEWCDFLKKHRFLVGLSIDGPREQHDRHRRSKAGEPTFERVMQAVRLLHRFDIPFNAMCVVTRANARKPLDVYRFLRDEVRARVIQFIPVVEPSDFTSVAPGYGNAVEAPVVGTSRAKPGNPGSVVTEWSVDPDDWGFFLTCLGSTGIGLLSCS